MFVERKRNLGYRLIYRVLALGIGMVCITSCSDTNQVKQLERSQNQSIQNAPVNVSTSTPSPTPTPQNLTFNPPPKFAGKTLYKVEVPNNEKVIALTFDDGPWKVTTPQMLEILQQNDVKATFFVVGSAIQANPDIFKQVVADGHAIANHTFNHLYKRMDVATARSEIERTADLIYETTGVKTKLFRPPGGYLNNGLASYAKSQNFAVIMWSQTSADTDPRAKYQVFVKNVLRDAKPGNIVLMHDGGGDRSRTVQALPKIIAGLKEKGYRFVTVPQILSMGK